jgi:hypothetical protein
MDATDADLVQRSLEEPRAFEHAGSSDASLRPRRARLPDAGGDS